MRLVSILTLVFSLAVAPAVSAKERAAFLGSGTYATASDCEKQHKIDAGGPRNVETSPELLTADGIKGWEGECEFTKVFEHEPGKIWIGLMYCVEGAQFTPQSYLFMKSPADDSFEVAAQNQDMPDVYVRCDPKKGK